MTVRQFWTIVVVVSLVTLARNIVGDGAAIAYFVFIGLLGVVGTIAYHRRRQRIIRGLDKMSDAERERTLILLENNPLRAGLVADLDVKAPIVPLRGEREIFRYPADASRTGRWTMYMCGWLAAFFGVGALSDALLGAHQFVGRDMKWWELPVLFLGFGGAAVLMWWSTRESKGTLEITDEAITWSVPGRADRRIAWQDVTEAKLGRFPQAVRLRSNTQRIGVSDTLVDLGRAMNLIATRLPPTATVTR